MLSFGKGESMAASDKARWEQSGNQHPCFPIWLSIIYLGLCLSHLDCTCFPNLALPKESYSQSQCPQHNSFIKCLLSSFKDAGTVLNHEDGPPAMKELTTQ